MVQPSKFLMDTAGMDILSTGNLVVWLRDMANFVEASLREDPLSFEDQQTLFDWLDELKYLV